MTARLSEPQVSAVSESTETTLGWVDGYIFVHTVPPRTIMSTTPTTSSTHSDFLSVFNAALEGYKRKTKKDLASHPLLPALQFCNSPEAVLTVLREQIPVFNQSQNGDGGLTEWVTPTINVLYSFSATLGGGVGLVNTMMFLC